MFLLIFLCSKHRKSRVLSTPSAEFSRSISVPADRVVARKISQGSTGGAVTPTTPELE